MTTLKDTSEEAEFLAKTYALDFPGKNAKTLAKDVFQEVEMDRLNKGYMETYQLMKLSLREYHMYDH